MTGLSQDTAAQALTMTVEEAARVAGMGAKSLYKLVHRGEIRHIKAGRRFLIPRAAFLRWLGQSEAAGQQAMPFPAAPQGGQAQGPAGDHAAPGHEASQVKATPSLKDPGVMVGQKGAGEKVNPPATADRSENERLPAAPALRAGAGLRQVAVFTRAQETAFVSRHPPENVAEHRQKIQSLAGRLAEGIWLPSLWDMGQWPGFPIGFEPGRYPLPLAPVVIGEDGRIEVRFSVPGEGVAPPHLTRALFAHLGASGPSFPQFVGEGGLLQGWPGRVARYCESALGLLRGIVQEVRSYGAPFESRLEGAPGFTRWFPLTVWWDAFQRAGGGSWIDDSWYAWESDTGSGLWQLACGAYELGAFTKPDECRFYQHWHRELRCRYAGGEAARDLAAEELQLRGLAQEIRRRLGEFSDYATLTGRCALETQAGGL